MEIPEGVGEFQKPNFFNESTIYMTLKGIISGGDGGLI